MFDWFGLVCFVNINKNCQLPYNWIQTSQTGGQWYSDTSPFSIPWPKGQKRASIYFSKTTCGITLSQLLNYLVLLVSYYKVRFFRKKSQDFFLVKWVPDWGMEQRESGKTLLCRCCNIDSVICQTFSKNLPKFPKWC
jgi:hypothetical protein